MSRCTSQVRTARSTVSISSGLSRENATRTRSTLQAVDEVGQVVEPAQERRRAAERDLRQGVVVDEAEDVDPELGVLAVLVGDEASDPAGAHDDDALAEPRTALADRPRDGAQCDDVDERGDPEGGDDAELGGVR